MNRLDHLLWHVSEEASEVAKNASKAARFGLSSVAEGRSTSNADRLVHEYLQLVAAMEMLESEGHVKLPQVSEQRRVIEAKKEKFEGFLAVSRAAGRLMN